MFTWVSDKNEKLKRYLVRVTSKGIPKNWTSNPKSINIIGMILNDIYNNNKLKSEIDYYLNDDLKINSIKVIRQHYEADVATAEERKYSLRVYKDTIDIYQKRMKIQNKLGMLRERIELWCKKNGYDNMGLQREVKSKTGEYTYRYSDWEFIDDHYGLMINDCQWLPSSKQIKKYNELWKKYDTKYGRGLV